MAGFGGARLYPRHRVDASPGDVLFGLRACFWASGRRELAAGVERGFGRAGGALVCLSVRSGFDLLLGVLGEPPEGEVLVSSVTHPDMVRIIEAHGLRAVPVDLDAATLGPRVDLMEQALSPRTRAVVVAHLFGGRFDLGPVAAFAKRHDLLLVEDCAQAFGGPDDAGDPRADVSMFSFGQIKTATAAGGAILRVRSTAREPDLLDGMRRAQGTWPVQGRLSYAGKLIRTLLLVLFAHPPFYGALARACDGLGKDLDGLVNGAARSFAAPGAVPGGAPDLLQKIRRRPSAPLLALLARRLQSFAGGRLARRAALGEEAARGLRRVAGVSRPGELAEVRTHWLFPIVVEDPEAVVRRLRANGFDASKSTSNLAPVPPPRGLPGSAPAEAVRIMSRVVYLPVYPELPADTLRRLILAVEGAVEGARLGPGAGS